ncbi:MAG: hypothetical protein ACLGGX_07725 [Bdellovibrionia bacterium]
METVKDVTMCTMIGCILAGGAALGIFGATMAMCGLATLGVIFGG